MHGRQPRLAPAGRERRFRHDGWNLPSILPADFWPVSFPVGYACGACTPKPDGGSSFEGFAPSPCDQVEITTYTTDLMCDWT